MKFSLLSKLDREFSKYIRLRDAMGSYFRCISCGKIKPIQQADCGHFYSRRHMATRWDEDNCNAECRACNRFDGDHLLGYRERLRRKIGDQRFAALAIRAKSTRKWSEFELERLIEYYKQENKQLEQLKGIRL